MGYYYNTQQPATVNPNNLVLDPGSGSYAQGYASSAYQNAGYDEPGESSAAAAVREFSQFQCEDCGKVCDNKRDYNKHRKTHDKPIECKADKNCKVTKAEQRDMDRHYCTAHKDYAARKGISADSVVCGFEGCTSTFTRPDNLLKHWKKYHGYEE
ncbi:hypothetical protein FALBO_5319 [Fusarium albosuccineum]|uniref:C2H2-type domain-containing protein n=1 Tax=Fusarium albosuccineum TaxID=1237068 RepID=A0A8H4LHW1_9HYPO|nr:hypothetical protein FALBO_5319 [Fusarium albosuccineum]